MITQIFLPLVTDELFLRVLVFIFNLEHRTDFEFYRSSGTVRLRFPSEDHLEHVLRVDLNWHHSVLTVRCRGVFAGNLALECTNGLLGTLRRNYPGLRQLLPRPMVERIFTRLVFSPTHRGPAAVWLCPACMKANEEANPILKLPPNLRVKYSDRIM